ncbi:hypothetical protein ACFFP0_02630 [Rhizobium puerariae]|uniref:Uncharacterized protein n=1 Tax=Rhizobium puerariae TaxID=1585791 RepID=A0ABV6ACZ6_9HYPH
MTVHEKINAGASACAVLVSIFSAVVSCSSQKDVEQIKQSYSVCNTKVESLNEIIQSRFPDIDSSLKEIAIIMYNPSGGLPILPTDPEKLRTLFGNLQSMGNAVDRIWREARPYMTGERRTKLQVAYQAKFDSFQAITDANNAGRQNQALGPIALNALNAFLLQSPQLITDEIEATLSNAACGVNSPSA